MKNPLIEEPKTEHSTDERRGTHSFHRTSREGKRLLEESENFWTGLRRSSRIFLEFMRGFYLFRNVNHCVTIFGSARFDEDHKYYKMARQVGCTLAQAGFTVMTGGGPGIMEAANRGAKEGGGYSIGCNILIPDEQHINDYLDQWITFRYFFVRKVILTKYSSAFIVMPGGLGTMDEFFETQTLIQTHKIRNFPLVLMGKDYWQPLLDYMSNQMAAHNTIDQSDVDKIKLTDSADEAIALIQQELFILAST